MFKAFISAVLGWSVDWSLGWSLDALHTINDFTIVSMCPSMRCCNWGGFDFTYDFGCSVYCLIGCSLLPNQASVIAAFGCSIGCSVCCSLTDRVGPKYKPS